MMKRGNIKPLTGLLLIVVMALYQAGCSSESQSKDNEDKDSTAAIPVEIAQVSRGDMAAYYTGTTTLEAENEATVVAKVSGIVNELKVEEGDYVKKSEVLAQLEDEQLEIEAQRAKATMEKLENDYKRNKELYDKQLISAEQYDNSRYEYESQKSAYELAKLKLEYSTIRAPISGVISKRSVKVGNMISQNEELFKITDFDPLLAVLHVPEYEMNKLSKGQKAVLQVDAHNGRTFEGYNERISPVVDPETGTFKVTVAMPDKDGMLKPGMFGRIKIVYDTHPNTLMVPKDAVMAEDASESVYVVHDKMAFRRDVNTGYVNGNMIEITNGLQPDEMVVTIGQSSLKDSAMVDIIQP